MDVHGLTALVTGGAAGIGAGIAQRLAAEGMDVVIADLDREAGAGTADGIGGTFVQAGRLGVLVNNAGGFAEPCFPGADPARWGYTLDLNLRGVMLAAQLVREPMAFGGGAIITVASVAGLGTTSHDCPEYAVAKAGVIRFTACLAPWRESMGVRANCICPGLVDTPAGCFRSSSGRPRYPAVLCRGPATGSRSRWPGARRRTGPR